MDQNVDLDVEQLGWEAAGGVAGPENVERVEVVEQHDPTDKPAYYLSFLIEQDRDRLGPGHLHLQLARRLRDALTARGDFKYAFVEVLNRADWNKRWSA